VIKIATVNWNAVQSASYAM